VRLLDRLPHGTEPTPYARALVTHGTAAFNELKQGIHEIENLAEPASGELRIAGSEPIVVGLYPAVIDRLSRRYPRLVFHLSRVAIDPRECRALREREIEFIVGRLPQLETEEDLEAETLFDDPLCVAAGEQNLWMRCRPIALAKLIKEPWVALAARPVHRHTCHRSVPLVRSGASEKRNSLQLAAYERRDASRPADISRPIRVRVCAWRTSDWQSRSFRSSSRLRRAESVSSC
jgi:DNA-binding transcriptional LysR family regulator